MAAPPPAPVAVDATQMSVTLRLTPYDGATAFIVQVAGFDGNFEQPLFERSFAEAGDVALDGLQPASTYTFRVIVEMADGSHSEPSQFATADTAVGSCGPTRRRCSVQ
mmetsp:Transcript_16398/g.52151  ORF Transcript_16398/g.52151 Transcript_16398/m.52151 type:complete len:108 (+) Transcript_16398:1282-1605(+)